MRDWAHHRYTWAEYLSFERGSNSKNEFFNGEIYAMAGGTPRHAQLAARLLGALGPQLKGKGREGFTSDLRVRVLATGLATYPDVSVICGKVQSDPQDANTATNPTVLIEVVSNSSEEYDRGAKFEQYKQIPTLREYVLVSHREPLIEVHRRTGTEWSRVEARVGAVARLETIDCGLIVGEVYAGVDLLPE